MLEYFDPSSERYAHLIELERAVMARHEGEPAIAIWDLFNEPEVGARWENRGVFRVNYPCRPAEVIVAEHRRGALTTFHPKKVIRHQLDG